ncbi:four helix bundle protein [Nitratireductor sp. L1-7-SE]|uniref:Four helix bundle protein n=1 Tax=Nitratireductor rhodophyticola TaxID=2854036 RepID=A0ABS7R244_9HYPH|nr:four helix bundle protein [Nitratireductor rhodophyticola]MBY8915000.1 four helix bundle protein [Nitratireductor rhodophyticola]MBY8919930.1 four helix bundle protein [Nitratireductor rhodophyticola]
MTINSYRDLLIWKAAMDLATDCYRATGDFPKTEIYGLTSQIRRAAGSVPANIAEGHGRELTGAFIQFLRVAQGSLKELETHLMLASRLSLLEESRLQELLQAAEEIGKMIRSMIRRLQEKSA